MEFTASSKPSCMRAKAGSFNICLSFAYAIALNILIWIPVAIFERDFAALVNCTFRFINEYQRRWYNSEDQYLTKLNKYATLSFYFTWISVTSCWFCVIWLYVVAPLTAPFPYEALPSFFQGWIAYLVIGYWYCFLMMRIWATFGFIMVIVLIYIICLFPIITNHLRGDQPLPSSKFEEIRNPVNLSRVYRSVEIWHKLFLENCGYLLVPIQSMVGQYALLVNYSLITKWDEMEGAAKALQIFSSVMVQGAWLGFATFGTWFNNNSVKMLKSWKKLSCKNKGEMKYIVGS
ncbi:hypothetical protein Fcan01_22878 [Folsomia candida]|uniref:Uncharacterized protein n=1 Tax=Folsomia candida TaxID=158441 RepID=A0A226DBY6_FOLCA|nr:hypothetical protein Fcan01_22878 [Folsomia candida]